MECQPKADPPSAEVVKSMTIFEILFGGGGDTKRIYRQEFEQAIKSLPLISDKEREYLRGIFSSALKDGITELELKKIISSLEHNYSDTLDAMEVEQVKRKLFGELEDNK